MLIYHQRHGCFFSYPNQSVIEISRLRYEVWTESSRNYFASKFKYNKLIAVVSFKVAPFGKYAQSYSFLSHCSLIIVPFATSELPAASLIKHKIKTDIYIGLVHFCEKRNNLTGISRNRLG
jgi:hypothetical protein